MVSLLEIHKIRGLLSQCGCPNDLIEAYLTFLSDGRQQVQVVKTSVAQMFQKEMKYRKQNKQAMTGSVTFSNKDKKESGSSETGIYIGIEFILCCLNNGILAKIDKIKREKEGIQEILIQFIG